MAAYDQLWYWLAEASWIWLPLVAFVLLGFASLFAVYTTSRRGRLLSAALGESTGSRLVVETGPGWAGFRAHFQPPPEPFSHVAIAYKAAARFDPLRWFAQKPRQDRLWIHASLSEPPGQELYWRRGVVPGRAAGPTPSASLWTIHRLDFIESEFATRGANPSALIHVFTELQTRFEPLLHEVSVLRETQPALAVGLSGRGLEPADVFPLVALVRAAGRAARLA